MKKSNKKMIKPEKNVLINDIHQMIKEVKSKVAFTVNAGLTLLYWRIGKRIIIEILKGKRAEYGEEILPTLSAKLVPIYCD